MSMALWMCVFSKHVLPVSPMSLLSCLPAGPSSHATLPARCTQPQAHELSRQKLRLHPCGPLTWTWDRALLWGCHYGNRAGQGVWEKQRWAVSIVDVDEMQTSISSWWRQVWLVMMTIITQRERRHFKSKLTFGHFNLCVKKLWAFNIGQDFCFAGAWTL